MAACFFIPGIQGAKGEGLGVEATPGYMMKFCPPNQNKTKIHTVSYTVKTTQ